MSIVSNTEIMDMFREIDVFQLESNLPAEELAEAVRKRQNDIVDKLAFLVYGHARPYRNFSNYEDLVQEGFVGLLKAVRKFQWARFPNFFVYSNQWIRHNIKYAASRFDVVYNPNRNRVIYSEPTEEEEVPLEELPEEVVFNKERAIYVDKVLSELPRRDREIVQMIFGLGGYRAQTLREIGPQFNLTYERVRQIKNNVIDRLRKNQTLCDIN